MNNRIGEVYIMNGGYSLKIIEYFSSDNCTVEFEDGTILYNIKYSYIRDKSVKNRMFPNIFNKGYLGIGNFKCSINGIRTKCYSIWNKIHRRSYDYKTQEIEPTYIGCSVAEEWHNFQNFAEWYEENWNPETMQNWQIDKDILIKGNKIYSPETCCFVPHEINSLLTNKSSHRGNYPIGVQLNRSGTFSARCRINGKTIYLGTYDTAEEAFQDYKKAKEQYIKEVADKWRGQITEQVYQALINYKIEIND